MLAAYLGCRMLLKFFIRKFFCEPGFKAYCTSFGKGLTTATHLPWVQGKGRIVVGDDVTINGRIAILFAVRYSDAPTLEIGDRSTIGHGSRLVIGKCITIGQDCLIANEVIVFDAPGHSTSPDLRLKGAATPPEAVKPVTICDNSWIGQRVIIYPGVTIGKGAVVSAGSVVMNDVAPNTIVAGNPARRASYPGFSQSASFRKDVLSSDDGLTDQVSADRDKKHYAYRDTGLTLPQSRRMPGLHLPGGTAYGQARPTRDSFVPLTANHAGALRPDMSGVFCTKGGGASSIRKHRPGHVLPGSG